MSDSVPPACADCGSPLLSVEDPCASCATVPATNPPAGSSIPIEIPGLRIERLIGAGGMGHVYAAEEIALGRRIAVKTIPQSKESGDPASERFVREARLMATVEDPNVVRVYSFGESDDQRYLVMEYVDGESLASRLQGGRRLPVDSALRIALQIAFGLGAAASKGVIHRDVKPGNILIDKRDNVRMTDFGLSRSLGRVPDDTLTQEGQFVGTPRYVAPEQASGLEVGNQADMYSLGIVLYEMLAGDPPFTGSNSISIIAKHLHEPLPRVRKVRPDVSKSVEDLIGRLTEKNPGERPKTWDEVIEEIQRIMRTHAAPITALDYLRMSLTPGGLALSLTVSVLLLVIGLVLLLFTSLVIAYLVSTIFGAPGFRLVQNNGPIVLTISFVTVVACFALLSRGRSILFRTRNR